MDFRNRALDGTWQMRSDADDIPEALLAPLQDQIANAQALLAPSQSGQVTYADLKLPEWFLRIPAPSSPFDQMNTSSSNLKRWLARGFGKHQLSAHNKLTAYLITGRQTDFLQAFDTAATLLKSLQIDMDNQLRSWRSGNKSAVIPRRIAQIGFEIQSLEEFIQEYFGDDTSIAKLLETRARATYGDGVRAANKARERAERIATGELKVGGKLTLEDLAPKSGIVRSGQELEKLLGDDKWKYEKDRVENNAVPNHSVTPITSKPSEIKR
jgi:hypothetical protein